MTTKHTPGPWYPGCDGGEAAYQVIAGDKRRDEIPDAFLVAEVNNCMGMESKANARLIAAAPELLEACRTLVSVVEQLIPEESVRGVADVVLYQGRAAIAKATADDVAEATEVAAELGVEDLYFPAHGATRSTPAYKGEGEGEK